MNKKWDIEKVRAFVGENSNCKLLSTEYNKCSEKLDFECECGVVFSKTFTKFNSGGQRTCPKCSSERNHKMQTKSNDDFLKEVREKVDNEYTFLEEYKGARVKMKIRHNTCGNEYEVTPTAFFSKNRRCSKCNGGVAKTEEQFKLEVFEKYKGEYEVIGEYIGARKNIRMKHVECGCEFEVTPDNFLRECSACHRCNGSFGERRIIDFLEKEGVEYKAQHIFDGLKRMKFDFVIFGEQVIAIEYDGLQHFEPVEYFGGVEKLKKQQMRDEKKNNYCQKHNIPLIRIPYWEFDNIEKILKDAI